MSYRKIGALIVVVALAGVACATIGSDTTTPPLDPSKMQAYMTRNFSHVPNLTEAMGRVILAANGGHPAGVSYTQTANGINGTVLIDVKGDGTDSATVHANIVYNTPSLGIAGGATGSTTINTANLTGSSSSNIAVVGSGSSVTLSSGTANLQYVNGPELNITNGNITINTATSLVTANASGPMTILGSADFHADSKSGTIFFESNGAGGWRIRVVSPDFATFTVP